MDSEIEIYERNRRELQRLEMAEARSRSKRERDAAMATMMGNLLGQMATSSSMAAVFVKDSAYAAKCAADGARYMTLAALAYGGVPAEEILAAMNDQGAGGGE